MCDYPLFPSYICFFAEKGPPSDECRLSRISFIVDRASCWRNNRLFKGNMTPGTRNFLWHFTLYKECFISEIFVIGPSFSAIPNNLGFWNCERSPPGGRVFGKIRCGGHISLNMWENGSWLRIFTDISAVLQPAKSALVYSNIEGVMTISKFQIFKKSTFPSFTNI